MPLPWDPSQVAYVWVDALPNYLSALTYARDGENLVETFWPGCHLLAKDILRFHCVFWPALLISAGYEVPKQLFVHGWLLLDDAKMSKSRGNVIDPLELIDVYGADAVRYWCARSISFGHDGSTSVDSVRERYERELGNDLGNLVSRTTAMIARYRDGSIPAAEPDADIARAIEQLATAVPTLLDIWDLTGALDAVWELVRRLNRFVEERRPWDLAKDEANAEALDSVLYSLADWLRAAAVALAAYLPETSPQVLAALGQPADAGWDGVAPGRTRATDGVEAAAPLFPRIEVPAPA